MFPQFVHNRFRSTDIPSLASDGKALAVHRSVPGYRPTPLVSLPGLAAGLGIGALYVKDEGQRFGLKAFKSLGALYAVCRWLKQQPGLTLPEPQSFYQCPDSLLTPGHFTFTAATDGNHGRGVAWVAQLLGQRARIYIPKGSTPARIRNIESHGAEVIVVDGSYDDAVDLCRSESTRYGWQVFSDTAWDGYRDIPRWIAAGYLTLFDEIHGDQDESFTPGLVIVQGGIGALASTVAWYYNQAPFAGTTKIAMVEPVEAACLAESISSESGEPVVSAGALQTIMAGLNCGVPSPEAWRQIRPGVDYFVTITDDDCRAAMRRYYHAQGDDPRIVSGESGAAGLGALLRWRERFGLSSRSIVLLLNTEADTDPAGFCEVVG